ncbi:ATP-dependent DNA helicase PIF1 [Paramuricea clavata]|uniref:ATP-dependent DNA helicase PIF1 n=1 Tax=Paramuricea clavata TaxID=317549 RepID=A0A6S7I4K8_PARCT|nr:ATP-dependent DNA helicase PIF1 [Paramuricea clavata]
MRQREDQVFAQVLINVRIANYSEEDIALLKSREISKSDVSYPTESRYVFKTNKDVVKYNSGHLRKLTARLFHIKAIYKKKDVNTGLIDVVISTKPSETGGLREVVSVAVGARIMLIVNIDVSHGLANGVCGSVVGIDSTDDNVHAILVQFDSRRVGVKAIAESHQYRQTYLTAVPIKRQDVQFYTGRGRRSVQAIRTQFPLTLAWACTIHKVQGKTLDSIVVSMKGRGRFMPGQAYVATFLKEGQLLRENEQILPETRCFRADRPSLLGRGGGLMTFASTELSPLRYNLEIQGLEYFALAVTKDTTQVNIVSIYRPPSMIPSTFNEKFHNLVNQLRRNILTIILGDFNIDLLQFPNHDIVQYMNQLGFYQFVKVPTTDYGPILDHVYINSNDLVVVEIVDTYHSDHDYCLFL